MTRKPFPVSEALARNSESFKALAVTNLSESFAMLQAVPLLNEAVLDDESYTHVNIARTLEYDAYQHPLLGAQMAIARLTLAMMLEHESRPIHGTTLSIIYKRSAGAHASDTSLNIPNTPRLEPVEFELYQGDIVRDVFTQMRSGDFLYTGALHSSDEYGKTPSFAAEGIDAIGSTVHAIGYSTLFDQYQVI